MKVYVTKYALTQGIFVIECKEVDTKTVQDLDSRFPQFFYKPHWHMTREGAIRQAEKMRQKRIESLQKQLAYLETLTFEPPEQQ